MDQLEKYKNQQSATFKNSDGVAVGTGKIIRISDVVNQQTQSADVFYSIQPKAGAQVYNGQFLTITIPVEETKDLMAIPRAAMKKDQVMILVGDKLVAKSVRQEGTKGDSLFVSGLTNGDKLVLEEIEKVDPTKKYIGIKR